MSSNFKLSKLISNMTLMQTTWFFKNIICFSFFHLCIVLAFGCFPKIHWSHTLPQGCSRLIKNRVAKHFKKPSVYYGKKLIVLKKKSCFPHDSVVKNPPAVQETKVQSLGREDALKKEMATHSSILAWEIPL